MRFLFLGFAHFGDWFRVLEIDRHMTSGKYNHKILLLVTP